MPKPQSQSCATDGPSPDQALRSCGADFEYELGCRLDVLREPERSRDLCRVQKLTIGLSSLAMSAVLYLREEASVTVTVLPQEANFPVSSTG